jgi:hypothetical protein
MSITCTRELGTNKYGNLVKSLEYGSSAVSILFSKPTSNFYFFNAKEINK